MRGLGRLFSGLSQGDPFAIGLFILVVIVTVVIFVVTQVIQRRRQQ